MRNFPIIEYKIIEGQPGDLATYVNDAIRNDWQPYGPPVMTSTSSNARTYVTQAMVKYDYSHGFIRGE